MNYYDYLTKKLTETSNAKNTIKTHTQQITTNVTNIFNVNKPSLKLDGNSIFTSAEKEDFAKINYDNVANAKDDTTDNIPEEKKLSPLEFIIKEFLSFDKVKEKADSNSNGELSADEVKEYIEELVKQDGNADDLTLDDFEAVIKELGIDLEELINTSNNETPEEQVAQTEGQVAQAEEPISQEQPAMVEASNPVYNTPTVQAPSQIPVAAPSVSASPSTNTIPQPKTVDNMSLEELKAEKATRVATLNEKQKIANAVLNGENENIKIAKADEAKAKEEYEKAVKEDAGAKKFANDILKNNQEIENNQKALDENARKIGDFELKLDEAENLLSGSKGELSSLESALSTLGSKDENKEQIKSLQKQISDKKKEISKQEKTVADLKKDIEKLNKEKDKLENEKNKLEEKKAELDEKVKQYCAEDTKAKLEAYNSAKEKVREVKSTELAKAKNDVKTAKDSVNEINKKINDVIAKSAAAKYTSSSTTTTPTDNYNASYWASQGLDTSKAGQLAQTAAAISRRDPGQCVGYTRKAINHVYGTSFTNAGPAYNFGNKILSSPELKGKFKKVGGHPSFSSLPDGAIVIYSPGSPGYTRGKAALYGHGGIKVNNAVVANGTITSHLNTYQEAWIPVA